MIKARSLLTWDGRAAAHMYVFRRRAHEEAQIHVETRAAGATYLQSVPHHPIDKPQRVGGSTLA